MKVKDSVEKHFEHRSNHYSKREAELNEEKLNPFLPFLETAFKGNERVLDVGCGSGYLLGSIKKRYPKTKLYGIDLTEKLINEAKKRQNPEINFQKGDVLNLPFENNSFDVVIFKDLLHHIVRDTQEDSKKVAVKALKEIKRVAKPKAYLMFYEEVMGSKFTSKLIFNVTKICFKWNISIPFLYVHKYIIVSFLTEKELEEMLSGIGAKFIEKKDRKLHLRWKYKINLILPIMLRNAKNLLRVYRFE
ncbi:MAG: class I SAM-dependent methyltransferase [Candidatus Diapherotrites archaeon]